MTKNMPHTAFILAAGKGTRLRPYTDNIPKPMALLNGKPIIGYIIENLIAAGIQKIIINLYYKGEVIEDYVSRYKDVDIILSHEHDLLDTGGGVKNALHHINEDSFFLINGDAFWVEPNNHSIFQAMANEWDPDHADMLLLLQKVDKMKLTQGIGDYNTNDKLAIRSLNKDGQYMFAGIRIVKKSVIEKYIETVFSFLKLMDQAEQNNKLYNHIFTGDWHHISTPKDLENVDQFLKESDE